MRDLTDKVARAVLARPGLHGSRYGVVRKVRFTGRGKRAVLVSLSVQFINPDAVLDARSPSAKCRGGPRCVLSGKELDSVAIRVRGKFLPLKEVWR
jgi:hypothetical protein